MTQAATLTVSLALPSTAGAFPQPPWPPSPGLSVQFTSAYEAPRIVIAGAGTLTLADLTTLLPTAGAQLLLVTLDPTDNLGLALTAPVRFNLTGTSSGTIWLPIAGGFFALAAPGTVGSVTGMSIVTTSSAIIRIAACG